jgi:hypothetical protein
MTMLVRPLTLFQLQRESEQAVQLFLRESEDSPSKKPLLPPLRAMKLPLLPREGEDDHSKQPLFLPL